MIEGIESVTKSHLAATLDKEKKLTYFSLPADVREQIEEYVNDNDTSLQQTIMLAFTKMGVHVEDEDLVHSRKRRLKPRKPQKDGTVGVSIYIPNYVRFSAEEILRDKPNMRLVNLLLAGLQQLGIKVDDRHLSAGGSWARFNA